MTVIKKFGDSMTERKLFQKQDLILIAIVLALASASFAIYTFVNRNAGKVICRVSLDGKLAQTIDLSNASTFFLEQNPQVRFEVKDGAIAFIESDCSDKVCINSGFLSKPGQMAACLPNRMSIHITSESGEGDVDMIAN